MAILDTNLLIDAMRRRPGEQARRSIKAIRDLANGGERLATTRLNVAELYVGVALANAPDEELRRIRAALAPLEILEFDDAAARAYGGMQAFLQRVGKPVGDFDALIASIAIANSHDLYTRNPGHFGGIPALRMHAV